MINSFKPVIDMNSRVLILGSMPGEESIKKQEYYGNTRNHFWRIMFKILNVASDNKTYDEKIKLLLSKNIALWDVLMACDRQGSSDTNIKNAVANDFSWLFNNHPQIKYVYFNGKKAQELFNKIVPKDNTFSRISFNLLPSTSPANTVKFDEKLIAWKKIEKYI